MRKESGIGNSDDRQFAGQRCARQFQDDDFSKFAQYTLNDGVNPQKALNYRPLCDA